MVLLGPPASIVLNAEQRYAIFVNREPPLTSLFAIFHIKGTRPILRLSNPLLCSKVHCPYFLFPLFAFIQYDNMSIIAWPATVYSLAEDVPLAGSSFNVAFHDYICCTPVIPRNYEPDTVYISCTLLQLLQSPLSLSMPQLHALCLAHRTSLPQRKSLLVNELIAHSCDETCRMYVHTFRRLLYPRYDRAATLTDFCPMQRTNARKELLEYSRQQCARRNSANAKKRKYSEMRDDTSPHSYLSLPSSEFKQSMVDEWMQEFTTDRYTQLTCAVCAEKMLRKNSTMITRNKFTDEILALLCDPDIPERLLPASYNLREWNGAILDLSSSEVHAGETCYFVCPTCNSALLVGHARLPSAALANGNYAGYEHLPRIIREDFQNLTDIEKHVIPRARAKRIHFKLSKNSKSSEYGKNPSITSSYVYGNTIILPQDTTNFGQSIPMNATDLKDSVCVLFLGSARPENSQLDKLVPLMIHRSRVERICEWLIRVSGNLAYCGIDFSQSNLNSLAPGPDGIPAALIQGFSSTYSTLIRGDYTHNCDAGAGETSSPVMHHSAYCTTDADTSSYDYKIKALRHLKSGRSVYMIPTGDKAVSERNDTHFISLVWPHLDPFGLLGFKKERRVPFSMAAQVKHLLRLADPRFVLDSSFAYIAFNLVRRQATMERVVWSVPRHTLSAFRKNIDAVSIECLQTLTDKVKTCKSYKPSNDAEKAAFRLLGSARLQSAHADGTDGKRIYFRNEIRAMIYRHGLFTLFITINPYDKHDPIMIRLAGNDISLMECIDEQIYTAWWRLQNAAKRPDLAAEFFEHVVQAFLTIILRVDKSEPGLFGVTQAYHGDCENQGRTTYHMHTLIWLRHHPSPHDLREKLCNNEEYKLLLFRWLEEHMSTHLPGQNGPTSHNLDAYHKPPMSFGSSHPVLRRRPKFDSNTHEYTEYMVDLINECQYHTHGPTCLKGTKNSRPNDANCRLRIDGTMHNETTFQDEILLRRWHPRLNEFNELMVYCLQCNMDIAYVGSGEIAHALIYYVTNYVTKGNTPLHEGFAALRVALESLAKTPVDAVNDRSALIKCLNQMIGRTEVCAPQVHRYLSGKGDRYTSDVFEHLSWTQVSSYVRNLSDQWQPETDHALADDEAMRVDSEPDHHEDQDHAAEAREADYVEVQCDTETGFLVASDRLQDYMHRGQEATFESFSLYQFTAMVYCVKDGQRNSTERGANRVSRSRFLPAHPKYESHHLCTRMRPRTVLFYGAGVPIDVVGGPRYEDFARAMLILFKPWRSLSDLHNQDLPWSTSYENHTFALAERTIINNMVSFFNCKEAARKHQSRLRELAAKRPHQSEYQSALDANEEHNIPIEAWLITLLEAGLLSAEEMAVGTADGSSIQDDRDTDTPICGRDSEDATAVQNLRRILGPSHIMNSCVVPDAHKQCREAFNAEQYKLYHSQYARIKKVKIAAPLPQQANSLSPRHEDIRKAFMSKDRTETSKSTLLLLETEVKRQYNRIAIAMSLNTEQRRALYLVAQQIWMGIFGQPLRMYVGGVGGTGKTRVIRSVKELLDSCGLNDNYVLAAPTGAAAVLIGGNTVHSVCGLSVGGSDAKPNEDAIKAWMNVSFLIIDEISMTSARMLAKIQLWLTRLRPNSRGQPFGGFNVICLEDFGQLMPVRADPVFSAKHGNGVALSEPNRQQITEAIGVYWWRTFDKVVLLTENWRQKNDVQYVGLLARIRDGHNCTRKGQALCHRTEAGRTCNEDDHAVLLARKAERLGLDTSMEDAAIIVGTKHLRDALNEEKVKRFAASIGIGAHE